MNVATAFTVHDRDCRQIAGQYFAPGLDRDDLIQEGRIGLLKATRDFRGDKVDHGDFRTFARLCIRRQILTAVKTAQTGKHRSLNHAASLDAPPHGQDDGSMHDQLPSPTSVPFEQLLAQRQWERFTLELGRVLSDLEGQVVSRTIAGQTYLEIATELGIGTKTVDNALQRIKLKAHRILRDHDLDLAA